MDILTHGLLGGSLTQSLSRKGQLIPASLAGFLGGILADADILVRSSDDPLLNLEFHRAITHWLMFIPVGGLLAAMLLWPFLRRSLGFRTTFLYTTAGYATHALLDACTSYGTHLFGPFSTEPVAWNLISVVDPAATLLLVFGFGLALYTGRLLLARLGLILFLGYLALGWVQNERVSQQVISLAHTQGHEPERLVVKPTLGNLVLWRTLYQYQGRYYVNAVRAGLDTTVIEGDSINVLDYREAFADLDEGSRLYQDIGRFHRFSDGFLVKHPEHDSVIGDLRYAMLPQETAPIWGIRLPEDLQADDDRIEFEHFRRTDAETRRAFIDMVLGRMP